MFVRIATVSAIAILTLGCISPHITVPEEAVRLHLAQEEGVHLASVCSYEGDKFSEGAMTCMAAHRMVCDPKGRWVQGGTCD